jgi:general stress protein YciG
MAGNKTGGRKAAQTNKERYDELYKDSGGFYGYIGRKGGQNSIGGGFANNKDLARKAGRKGGLTSRRPKVV